MSVFDLSSILRPLRGLKDRVAQVREQQAQLQAQRNALHNAPAARVDVETMLTNWVDFKATGFGSAFAASIAEMVRRPHLMLGEAYVQRQLTVAGAAGTGEPSEQIDRVLCALIAPQIKQSLAAALDGMDWSNAGLPLAARAKELARLDQQIEQLQSELDTLQQQAADAGIAL